MGPSSRALGLLVITAVPAEVAAVIAGFPGGSPVAVGPYRGERVSTPAGELTVLAGGVGPAAAAACAGAALAVLNPSLVLSVGVAGGFVGRAEVGEIVVADRVIHADLGAGSPDRFIPVDELGFGTAGTVLDPDLVALAANRIAAVADGNDAAGAGGRWPDQRGGPVRVGAVLTVSTVTGTAARTAELAARHGATAEAMEGAGVAAAAAAYGTPVLEIRGVSNPVGPRDRAGWDLPAALSAIERAMAALLAAPLPAPLLLQLRADCNCLPIGDTR